MPQQSWYFQAPERGRLRVTGADRAAFLHNMTTNDIKSLAVGAGCSAAIVNQRGQLLDRVDVYATGDALLVFTGPERAEADLAWLDRYVITEDVQLADLAADTAVYTLVGPVAGLPDLAEHGTATAALAGQTVEVFRTDDLLGPAHLLLAPRAAAPALEAALRAGGAAPGDAETYERLRIGAGLPGWGREVTEARNPWEARLDRSISLKKGCYLGQEIVARLNAYDKVQRYMVGLALDGAPPVGATLLMDDTAVGELTSVAGGKALGYVKAANAAPGSRLSVTWEGGAGTAVVEDRPYWAGKTRPVGAPSRG